MTAYAVLDDQLLLLHLAGRDDWLPHEHEPATAAYWWLRLARAIEGQRGGTLSMLLSRLPATDRDLVVSQVRRLPDHIVVPHPRNVVATAAALGVHHRLNVLTADVLATAFALDGRVLVAAKNDGPRLRQTANNLGVPYEVVEP